MVARCSCHEVLQRRPSIGLPVWPERRRSAANQTSELCAAARDPPLRWLYVNLAACRYADTTLGGHGRPPSRLPRPIPPVSLKGIARGKYQHYIGIQYPQESNVPGHRASLRWL